MTCVKKAGGAPTSNCQSQDQDLFCRWPRSGLVLPGQDPDLSRFGQDQDLFRRRPDFIKSVSWPGWQNKSGSCQGPRPRSGLIFLSPDLGQGRKAKIRTYFRFFFRANTGPRGRARQVRILPRAQARPRSGLKKISPDLGQGALAKVQTCLLAKIRT